MLRRRSTGWRARCVAGSLIILFVAANPASGGVISDRSAFVGDFTVIDFETRGDGTPLILDANDFWEPQADEFASLGFTMEASTNEFGHDLPFIANATGTAQSVALLQAAGSTPNVMFASGVPGFVRFSFPIPISAIGMAIMNRADSGIVRLEAFDAQGSLIEAVEFVDDLIDGTVLGSDFGGKYDFDYGFVGLSASDVPISEVIVHEWRTTIDDLHFAVIPEPSSIALWCVAAVILFMRTSRRCSRKTMTILLIVFATSAFLSSSAHAAIVKGKVTGWVMRAEHPICGDDGPGWCF